MALVKRGEKGSPISALEYDAVVGQVELNAEKLVNFNADGSVQGSGKGFVSLADAMVAYVPALNDTLFFVYGEGAEKGQYRYAGSNELGFDFISAFFEGVESKVEKENDKKGVTGKAVVDEFSRNRLGISGEIKTLVGVEDFIEEGYYRVSDGAFIANSSYKTTDFTIVNPKEILDLNLKVPSNAVKSIIYFDEFKNEVSFLGFNDGLLEDHLILDSIRYIKVCNLFNKFIELAS